MRSVFSCLLIGLTSLCVAQASLTNAQVYDFNVGDVIQGRYAHAGNPNYTYETKTILNKVYSNANDSIVYTIQVDHYVTSLTSCNTCTPSTASSIITETVTNLNQPASHNNVTSACYGTMDSLFTDYCGKTVWGKFPKPAVGCGPGQDRQETFVVAGLGGPYYLYDYTYNFNALQWMEYKLTYYSKDSVSCGLVVTSGIKEESLCKFAVSVYPNPSYDAITVRSPENIYFYDIMSLNGQVIKTGYVSSQRIDVSFLPKGNYLITFYTTDHKMGRHNFCKE